VENIDWGWRGNSLDVPTDCPQRDERLGWTGDAQVFIRTATYLREVDGFFAKYVQDLADAQEPSGSIPPTAPNTNAVGGDGGPAWSDAFIICPWQLYRAYGDLGILRRHYPAFRRFIDYLATTAENHIRVYEGFEGFRGFGDWLSIKAETPHELIGTAYYAYSVELMAKIAAALGESNDEARFADLHRAIQDAFIQKFAKSDGTVATGSQTSQVLALYFNLVPEELRPTAVQKLVDDIESRDWHLSTGFVGSSYLPYVLSDNGRLDVAYKLLHQKTWPSWLYAVTQGATTIWERWDGWTEEAGFQDPGMNSFNHYAYGAIGEWLFTRVAGIELDDSTPGFQRFVLRPMPGETLDWIECEFNSPHGLIRSNWKQEGSNLEWEVSVPPNTEATVHVPTGYAQLRLKDGEEPAPRILGAGQYHFVATN
jgi:alpha-L-rhamnosidase